MLMQLCSVDGGATTGFGLLSGLLLAGLAGSVMHCAPMCGPFVLGQVSDRLARVPAARLCELTRLRSGLLLPYHLGRLVTYATLGAVAATFGAVAGRTGWFAPVSGGLLLLGAAVFVCHAAARLMPSVRPWLPHLDTIPLGLGRRITRIARTVDRARWSGGFLLGLTLGFLPCGFLYAALAVAAAVANPVGGAAAMLAFGIGTVPTLIVVGIAGLSVGRSWQRGIAVVAPVVMLLNAGLLATLALRQLT